MKCRAVPYVKSTFKTPKPVKAQTVKDEEKEECDILRLIGELQSILPIVSNSGGDSNSTVDVVERAISYICDLEQEADPEDLQCLQQQLLTKDFHSKSI